MHGMAFPVCRGKVKILSKNNNNNKKLRFREILRNIKFLEWNFRFEIGISGLGMAFPVLDRKFHSKKLNIS